MKCDGWKSTGAFPFGGIPTMTRCNADAVVMLGIVQDGARDQYPACPDCWQEAIRRGVKIVHVWPILSP